MLPASAVFFMVFRGFVLVLKLFITQKSVSPSGNSDTTQSAKGQSCIFVTDP